MCWIQKNQKAPRNPAVAGSNRFSSKRFKTEKWLKLFRSVWVLNANTQSNRTLKQRCGLYHCIKCLVTH